MNATVSSAAQSSSPFSGKTAQVDEGAVKPLPRSRKAYLSGSRPDIRVPMREISQSDTSAGMGAEKNPPIYVYDTSGPYTDPAVKIDIRSGLAPLREKWIDERGDTEILSGPASIYGRQRLNDPRLAELRFDLKRSPRRARTGAKTSAGASLVTANGWPEAAGPSVRVVRRPALLREPRIEPVR